MSQELAAMRMKSLMENLNEIEKRLERIERMIEEQDGRPGDPEVAEASLSRIKSIFGD